MTLTDFLLARISEDKAIARAMRDDTEAWGNPYDSGASIDYGNRFNPARILYECEAKQRIMDACAEIEEQVLDGAWWVTAHEDILGHLAAVYVDHPDYQETWRA